VAPERQSHLTVERTHAVSGERSLGRSLGEWREEGGSGGEGRGSKRGAPREQEENE